MGGRTRVVWVFAVVGVVCGASTFGFLVSPLYRGLCVFSPGLFWSVFFCVALRASLATTKLTLGPPLWRIVLGALAPAVAYPLAALVALMFVERLADVVGLNASETRVLFVSSPLLIFIISIVVMLRIWSLRVGGRVGVEIGGAWLIVVIFNAVLQVFDQPALAAHRFGLAFVVAVTALFFFVVGRGVARSDVLQTVPA